MTQKTSKILIGQLLVALVLGAMQVFAFAPFEQWWTLYPSFTGLFILLQQVAKTNRRFFLIGFTFNLSMFIATIHWIYVSMDLFGGIPTPILPVETKIISTPCKSVEYPIYQTTPKINTDSTSCYPSTNSSTCSVSFETDSPQTQQLHQPHPSTLLQQLPPDPIPVPQASFSSISTQLSNSKSTQSGDNLLHSSTPASDLRTSDTDDFKLLKKQFEQLNEQMTQVKNEHQQLKQQNQLLTSMVVHQHVIAPPPTLPDYTVANPF